MHTKLNHLQVISSSGCHRYDYWHEQYLFDGKDTTGWCCPSRSEMQTEYLIVDLNETVNVSRIRILSRAINKDAGFPIDFSFFGSSDNANWVEILRVTGCQNECSKWHEWEIPVENESRYLKMEIYKVGRR